MKRQMVVAAALSATLQLSICAAAPPGHCCNSAASAQKVLASEGQSLYETNCALCHQRKGEGLAGQFPRLAGRVGTLAQHADGREYLLEVVLFGMAGRIQVEGTSIDGVMPTFRSLSDSQLAELLTYVSRLSLSGKPPKAFNTDEASKLRNGPALSSHQVKESRERLATGGPLP